MRLDLAKLRRDHEWIDHLVRAKDRYGQRYGSHYAAAVTYFSVLSLVPILMIGFAITGFVLTSQPALFEELKSGISEAVPGALGDTINDIVAQALESKAAVGIFGLLGAAYSGLGWMGNLRDALTAQWGGQKADKPFFASLFKDALALLGLGLAIVLSFALTAAGSGLARVILNAIGLSGVWWAQLLLSIAAIVLSLAANWLVFLWVLAKLPRRPVSWRSAVKGALAAAIGFEVLKQVGTIYLSSVTSSPAGAAFGPIIGILVFANLVAQFLLFITAWTATARDNMVPEPTAPPAPAVIRPRVTIQSGPNTKTAVALMGIGALVGFFARRK